MLDGGCGPSDEQGLLVFLPRRKQNARFVICTAIVNSGSTEKA